MVLFMAFKEWSLREHRCCIVATNINPIVRTQDNHSCVDRSAGQSDARMSKAIWARRVLHAGVILSCGGTGFDASRQVDAGPQDFVCWRYAPQETSKEAQGIANQDETITEARTAIVHGLQQLRTKVGAGTLVLYGPPGAGRKILSEDIGSAGAHYLCLNKPEHEWPSPWIPNARPGTILYRLYYNIHYPSAKTDVEAIAMTLQKSFDDWVLHGVHPEKHQEVIKTSTRRADGTTTVLSVEAPIFSAIAVPTEDDCGSFAAIRIGDPSSESAMESRMSAFQSLLESQNVILTENSQKREPQRTTLEGGQEVDELTEESSGGETSAAIKTPATSSSEAGKAYSHNDELNYLIQKKIGLRLADMAAVAAHVSDGNGFTDLKSLADAAIQDQKAKLRYLFGNPGIDEQVKVWLWEVLKLLSGRASVTLVGASHLSTANEPGAQLSSLPTFEYVGTNPPRLLDLVADDTGELLEVREPGANPGMPMMVSLRTPVSAAFQALYDEDTELSAHVTCMERRVHLAQDLNKLSKDLRKYFERQDIFEEKVHNLLQLVLTIDDPDDPEILHVRINLEAEKLNMTKSRKLLLRRLHELRRVYDEVEGTSTAFAGIV